MDRGYRRRIHYDKHDNILIAEPFFGGKANRRFLQLGTLLVLCDQSFGALIYTASAEELAGQDAGLYSGFSLGCA